MSQVFTNTVELCGETDEQDSEGEVDSHLPARGQIGILGYFSLYIHVVSTRVQPQCWSAQTRGHQQEDSIVEQTQEHSWLENILPGGQSVLRWELSHLQVQVWFWKVAEPGQEVWGP